MAQVRSDIEAPKGSYCVVASTLPAAFMAARFEALNVRKIFVMSEALEASFRHLAREKGSRVKIVRVPENPLGQALCFLLALIGARLKGRRVVFFHECCLPVFDLLVGLVRPKGYYLPQVSMSAWSEVAFSQFPEGRMATILRKLGVVSRFRFYRSPKLANRKREYVMSIREYPDTIKCFAPAFSRDVIEEKRAGQGGDARKLLFVAGQSSTDGQAQEKIYAQLIAIARSHGFACHLKDHPNPDYRLNLTLDGVLSLDPEMPAELLDEGYHLVVGVSSSALLNFGDRAISLLHLLEGLSDVDLEANIKHFEVASPGHKIRFITSLDEFEALLALPNDEEMKG